MLTCQIITSIETVIHRWNLQIHCHAIDGQDREANRYEDTSTIDGCDLFIDVNVDGIVGVHGFGSCSVDKIEVELGSTMMRVKIGEVMV